MESIINIIYLGHRLRLNMISDQYVIDIAKYAISKQYPIGSIIVNPACNRLEEIKQLFPNVSILKAVEEIII